MKITFTIDGWNSYISWKDEKKITAKIHALIKDILRDPFSGIGKPEPLKHDYSGCWSRRINSEHRLIYEVYENEIRIISCRYHY